MPRRAPYKHRHRRHVPGSGDGPKKLGLLATQGHGRRFAQRIISRLADEPKMRARDADTASPFTYYKSAAEAMMLHARKARLSPTAPDIYAGHCLFRHAASKTPIRQADMMLHHGRAIVATPTATCFKHGKRQVDKAPPRDTRSASTP